MNTLCTMLLNEKAKLKRMKSTLYIWPPAASCTVTGEAEEQTRVSNEITE